VEWAKKMFEAITVREAKLNIGELEAVHFTSLSKEIKGDLIDYYQSCDEKMIGVYDAFHHGIQAVLTLNILFSVFRANNDCKDRLISANKILRTFSEQQLCSAVTTISAKGRKLTGFLAGNPEPVVISGKNTRELKLEQNKPLGLADYLKIASFEVDLKPDEFILVSTNGLFKAFEKIAEKTLLAFLRENTFSDFYDCRQKILQKLGTKEISKFDDDITFIIVG
jgi:serine phosphatase RsbU (regulator of sigma subunit)